MTSVFFFNFRLFNTVYKRLFKKLFYFFWLHCTACRILRSNPSSPPAQDAQHFNHWTPGKVSVTGVLIRRKFAHRYRERDGRWPWGMQSETGMMKLQAKGCQGSREPPETRVRQKTDLSLELRGSMVLLTP